MITRRSVLTALAATTLTPTFGRAQDFPGGMVRLVVPYPAGGGVDGLARPLAEKLRERWGQSVLIENKPGANTFLGGDFVAKAPPDGRTLLFTSDSSITSNPHLFKTLPFDPLTALAPVTQLVDLHQMVVVHPSVAANSLAELVAMSKAKPGAMNYASYGNGSQPHLLFEMLKKKTGADITQVPYRGIAPALTGVIAGDVQMTLGSAAATAGFIEGGKLKPIAIGRATRLKSQPNVPTLAEAGFPEIDPRSWFGLFAPAATPPAIVAKIQQDVALILRDPDFSARYVEGLGSTAVASAPAEFADFIKRDFNYKRELIAASGATVE